MRVKQLLFFFACLFYLSATAIAAEPVSIQADGKAVLFEEALPPVVLANNQTYFPVRPAFEALGYKIGWDGDTRQLTAARENRTVRFAVASNRIETEENGAQTALLADTLPFIHEDTTYISARFFAQATGCLVGWDESTRTVIFTDLARIRSEYRAKFSLINEALVFMYPAAPFALSGTLSGSFEPFSEEESDAEAILPFSITLGGLCSGEAVQFDVSASGQAAAEMLPQTLPAAFRALLSGAHQIEGLFSLPENSLFLKSELLISSGVPQNAYIRLPLSEALGIFGAKKLTAGAPLALMRHDFSYIPAAAAQNLTLSDSSRDYILTVRSLFDTYANLYGDARFSLSENQKSLILQSAGANGESITETLLIALENSEIAAVSFGAASHAADADTALHLDWFGGGSFSCLFSAQSNSYAFHMEGEIAGSPAAAAPTSLPAGTIVP